MRHWRLQTKGGSAVKNWVTARLITLALAWLALVFNAPAAVDWSPVKGVLMTPYSASVSPTNVHPEYPRPQLVRSRWQSLNGLWDYAITSNDQSRPGAYEGSILVPFPVESSLSGVGRRLWQTNILWYRRSFTVPAEWAQGPLLLHFGAADWFARVYVNGVEAGRHRGGYDPFSINIQPFLSKTNEQELVVAIEDPTEGEQPRGKQSLSPEGIFYTPSSGLWQTVWLEPVPQSHIEGLRVIPDLEHGLIRLKAQVNRIISAFHVEAIAMEEGAEVARASGAVNTDLELQLDHPRPWSPEQPFLYDLKITLFLNGEAIDSVTSYCGLRDIATAKRGSEAPRILLNGKPLFQMGVLDQGFWPDGLYTAPSEEAWQRELGLLKAMGFNTVRKHVKVEPDRWYYLCDRLGLLVWQDMPSGNNLTPRARRQFEIEYEQMVQHLFNHPSIIMWVLFNEGWGQYDTERLVNWTKDMDPSRLVSGASGWMDRRVGDVVDIHSYPGPEAPVAESARAAVLGEFGGLGLSVSNHLWSAKSWAYELAGSREQLGARFTDLMKAVWMLRDTSPLSAAIYTQLSDVETECNGLFTYDRAILKLDPDKVRFLNSPEARDPAARFLTPPANYGSVVWRYTFREPGPRWTRRVFNLRGWLRGRGGFGSLPGSSEATVVGTAWQPSDIWLRRVFFISGELKTSPRLTVRYEGDAELFLNGVPAARVNGSSGGNYVLVPIADMALETLRDGPNLLAIHARSDQTIRYIDAGLLLPSSQ